MKTTLALSLSFMVCCASALPAAVRAQEPPALASLKDPAEHDRVAKLIEGAKTEGSFEWVGVYAEPEQAERIEKAFKDEYGLPDLHMEYTFVNTGELIQRVGQLIKAHRNNFDVVWTSGWDWYQDLRKGGDLLKYESPYYKEYTLSNDAGMSEPGYWVSDAYAQVPVFNTKTLSDRHIDDFDGSSYAQLTNASVKGLIALPDPYTSSSSSQELIGLVRVMGDDWLKRVVQNQPVLSTKSTQARTWLASGEYPITMGYAKDALKMKLQNLPVKISYPKEGVVMQPYAPVILNSAPHPNTAKLFIDFVRSAKGAQAVMDSGAVMQFGRPGVKSPDLEIVPPWENVKIIPMKWNEDADIVAIKKVRQLAQDMGLK